MNQGDTFDALYELVYGIVSKYSAAAPRCGVESSESPSPQPRIQDTAKVAEYPPNALPTLGTCDHIDIWGETGENGIACKSPAIKQCEGCGESMCKAHLVENTCRECAVKL